MFVLTKKYSRLLFRKQNLSLLKSLDTDFDRCLSTYQLIFYGISRMIGAGIYILTGLIIRDKVGPATNLSYLLSGFISIFTGLAYCEFATLFPKAGSTYTYTYLMMGELPAFIIGWTMLMNSIISLAGVAKGFSGAINSVFNGTLVNFTIQYLPLAKNSDIWDSSVDVVAVLLILSLFSFTLIGANISMNINCIFAIGQIGCLSAIIISCFIYGNHENYLADGGYLPFGFLSIFQGAGIVIFNYSGFESIANTAEEAKDPKKSIPIAMFTSLIIVIILYFLSSTGLSFLVSRLQIDVNAPFLTAFIRKELFALKWVAAVATILAIIATKFTVIYVIPRMIYVMANDGLLFNRLAKLHKKFKIPLMALFAGILLSCALTMFIKIEILADVTSIGIIISFIALGIDLFILRYLHTEKPDEESIVTENNMMKMRVSGFEFLANRSSFIGILICFMLSVIFFGLSFMFILPSFKIFGIIVCTISSLMILLMIFALSLYEPYSTKEAFETPYMPLTPVISVILSISIIIHFPLATWIRYFVCLSVGLIIYIFHGFSNSVLGEKVEEIIELLNVDKITSKISKSE